MTSTIEPEPTEDEREAILSVLAGGQNDGTEWSTVALQEGVEEGELDP